MAVLTTAALTTALIIQSHVALRAAPHDSAPQHAQLTAGEMLEIRGEALDYVQVYDYQRERAGYVRGDQVKRSALAASDADELLAVLRFVRDSNGTESLGIGLAAAYLKAAPANAVNSANGAEVLAAIGGFAERLAQKASISNGLNKLGEQLEVANQYGVTFNSIQHGEQLQLCYQGTAYRQLLALPATPSQQLQAVLGLTRLDCLPADLPPVNWVQQLLAYQQLLTEVNTEGLGNVDSNRLNIRRASIASQLSFWHQRLQRDSQLLAASGFTGSASQWAQQALDSLARVKSTDLADADLASFNDSAIQVSSNRWAVQPMQGNGGNGLQLSVHNGQTGETCMILQQVNHQQITELARRCSYGVVWPQSFSRNKQQTAASVAVQALPGWQELWVWRKTAEGWMVQVVPPTSNAPGLGYVEAAGWLPSGQQLLLAREARAEGHYQHRFEVFNLDSLQAEHYSGSPDNLLAFGKWQDKTWREMTISVR